MTHLERIGSLLTQVAEEIDQAHLSREASLRSLATLDRTVAASRFAVEDIRDRRVVSRSDQPKLKIVESEAPTLVDGPEGAA